MENGPYDTAWPYEIVHRDIKPENGKHASGPTS